MRTPFVFSITLAATASFVATARAAERLDAPGPGYREQVERFAPGSRPRFRRDLFETFNVRGRVWILPSLVKEPPRADDLSLAPAPSRRFLFEPIQLFEELPPHPTGFSFAVPLSLTPGTRQ